MTYRVWNAEYAKPCGDPLPYRKAMAAADAMERRSGELHVVVPVK